MSGPHGVWRGGEAVLQDSYGAMAEFHDLFMVEPWDELRSHVRAAFGGLPAEAIIVEIGAGSGIGTRVIAQETRARVFALEPDLVMRAILTARVADDPELASRVTVVAGAVPADLGRLPERVDGFVCAHMLGHLAESDRRALFAWLATHLSDDGTGLVTVHWPRREVGGSPDETNGANDAGGGNDADGSGGDVVEVRTLGEYEYRARHHAPDRPDESRSSYEVWRGEVMLRRYTFTSAWRIVTTEVISTDLAASLSIEPSGSHVALIRRTADAPDA
ncbi:class I SAM-dependent methyltransferase [Phytoactinopolyspora halotolerans]|uniref:Class I SAM-dependent methyltransferase n=1 Tax=Phytoactinopolyspora halotolerans TaxID=1981512 RepID=A0A6L9SI77_9ACTN|nr:class I SAM-dependent methyltransferase [Phytoactinopolyspora halotolerans]NEE04378.1 class I SAM-dependent methyltransferase [Phytoactinopolyspora halotolerans]